MSYRLCRQSYELSLFATNGRRPSIYALTTIDFRSPYRIISAGVCCVRCPGIKAKIGVAGPTKEPVKTCSSPLPSDSCQAQS